MKDIPGTITERFTLLLTAFFEIGEILSSSLSGVKYSDMQIEKRSLYRDMVGAEYRVATLITDEEELRIAMDHYNFLRKYKLV